MHHAQPLARDAAQVAGQRPAEQRAAHPARHRKASRVPAGRGATPARHRKPSWTKSAMRNPRLWVTAVVVTVATVAALAIGSNAGRPSQDGNPAALGRATALSPSGSSGHPGQPGEMSDGGARAGRRSAGHAVAPGPRRARTGVAAFYRNPLRAITGLIPERIDMGVDFGGTGPIYALGDAVVTSAMTGAGWPGGGWITYRLTRGPAAGLMVFVAEDVTPAVSVGQTVTSSTVIANMFNGGAGIETGWAQSNTVFAESQSAAAGGISGGGPFPTLIGLDFEHLLEALGVPAGYGADQPGNGVLPPGYPARW